MGKQKQPPPPPILRKGGPQQKTCKAERKREKDKLKKGEE